MKFFLDITSLTGLYDNFIMVPVMPLSHVRFRKTQIGSFGEIMLPMGYVRCQYI